ncbi:Alpha/Beta hydrolase protein [Diplogelasinospora grovesii]|uniref:Carboxylic ester hydrolase n=1 Tax=Diplogelasinospora grovesii TaxID=303347 RepID=A0AAN6N4X5_9PEZI|nr:Alpha/Beta hydrolase protein [Diplogelasinospora grovesii]
MSLRWVAVVASLAALTAGAPSPKSLKSDLSILINNDLQGSSSPSSTSGVIVLGRRSFSYEEALAGCQALGESLWSPDLKTASIQPNLDYLKYQGRISDSTAFWIAADSTNTSRVISSSGDVSSAKSASGRLPALCTQTAPYSTQSSQDTSAKWQVSVDANNQTLTGFRDRLSFRFLGIRYAPQPKRFTYSVPFEGSGESASALSYGSQCVQGSDTGSEDCLFLNIWTGYLPNPGCSLHLDKKKLKPVAFWIHGGAFTGGTANDNTFDGGNIVSRGDVVLVAINYRLTTLGFLALQDGVTNGNFGLADQVNALDWVRENIHRFGGDPDRITIFGQSAGAGSVRALMASPKAAGKFAAAIPLSNLGGINYGTTYSQHYTIEQEVDVAADAILAATNCTDASSPSQVDCLRSVPAFTLSSLSTVARYVVVDGTYITSPQLDVTSSSHSPPLPVKIMMGIMHDDGAPFISYPTTTNETAYLSSQGFSVPDPKLFPIIPSSSGNATLDLYNTSSRLATDGIFRCVDQATVYAGITSGRFGPVYYYEFDRSYQTSGWPGTDVCNPPRTATHPDGDPSLPYFKCHSGELYYVFGNLARQGLPMRDGNDLPMEQFTLDTFSSFIRTYNPNPDKEYLKVRGYENTMTELDTAGLWEPATPENTMTMRVLDWPSKQGGFRELPQCDALGLGLDYYYTKGSTR